MKYIAAIDQSTTGTKAMLFDELARPVFRTDMTHRQYYPQSGWVEIAFQCTYYWLLHARDFASAMCSIVSKLGDPDTNGAIAGALLGAVFGIDSIPYEWQQTVQNANHPVSRYRAAKGMEMLEELFEQAR